MLELDLQYMMDDEDLPAKSQFREWATQALLAAAPDRDASQIAIRIVDEDESAELNERWRHKNGPTNVLSFTMSGMEMIAPAILGDIVICAPVVKKEANEQSKTLVSHWAHMTIHGILHLLGYDHIEEDAAVKMESLEITIMETLGFTDPYQSV